MIASWTPPRGLLVFAALALLLYLIVDLRVFPLSTRMVDEERFISEALAFARLGEFHVYRDRAWEMPLVGIVYGAIYALAGSQSALIAAVRCLQALLLIAMAWFGADLAQRLFERREAAAFGFVGILVYPMFIAFQSLLLSEALFMLLLTAGIWCLYRWADAPRELSRIALYAAVMAAATYTKASLTWLPVLLPLLLAGKTLVWRDAARASLVAALVYCVSLSPWWIRNAQLFGEPVFFTTSSASNLYLGNNRANVTAGVDWNSDVERAFVDANERLPEVARDRAYGRRAIDYITSEPMRFVADMGRKLVRLWNIFPNHDAYQQGPYRLIIASSYVPALALALWAAWLYRHRWRFLLPVYALFAYLTLVHTVTIASLRYRLPLEVFLVVFAAGALAHLAARRKSVSAP